MKKFFILFAAFVASISSVFAVKVNIGDLYYNLDATNLTAEVTSQNSRYPLWSTTITSAIIPQSITYNEKTYSVTSIGEHAFSGCTELTSVTIPNSITAIGLYAFYNCMVNDINFNGSIEEWLNKAWSPSQISSSYRLFIQYTECSHLKLPEGITNIGNHAFLGCTSLVSLKISNSVTSVGSKAFCGCTGLQYIYTGNGVSKIAEDAFENSNNINYVEWEARSCNRCEFNNTIETFVFGNEVEEIPALLCAGMDKLVAVTIPDKVKTIGGYAFYGCTGLISVDIGTNVDSIGADIFLDCNNIKYVSWYAKKCNACHFGNQVKTFTFGDKVEVIPDSLCSGMSLLTEIYIPNSVTYVGNSAFAGCSGLSGRIEIPESVINIGSRAFYGCEGLTDITISKNVEGVGEDAFRNSNISQISFTGNIKDWCEKSWSPAEISSSYKLYIQYTLDSHINIPTGVSFIAPWAFAGCNSLYRITLPNSVSSIGESAFSGCLNLSAINIPNNITTIGDYAFKGCSNLPTFGNIKYADTYLVEASNTSLSSYEIKERTRFIGSSAFSECVNVSSIEIPSSVISIGKDAFYGCSKLTSIYAPCGELERFQQLLKNDSRVKYKPLPYQINIKTAANGSVMYPKNSCEELVLNAIPNYGYRFVKWSDGNTDNPRAFDLTQDTTFEASFATKNFIVDLRKNYSEMGSVTGGGTFEYLSTRTITATPNYGYHFVKWNGVGQQIPQNAISVSQAKTIASALSSGETTSKKYIIVGYITSKYGTYTNSYYISDDPNIAGTFIAFKCASSAKIGDCILLEGYLTNYKGTTPETTSGSSLTKIDPPSSANPYSFTLTRDTIIIAEFAKNTYTMTVQSADTAMGSVTGGGQFDYLTKCVIKATPKYGYHLAQWSDGNTDNPRVVTITRDTAFSATFGKNPIIRYIYDSSMGRVEGNTTLASQASGNITFKAVPNPGYKFVQWSDGNKDNPRTINLSQDTTMEAIFAIATVGNCGKEFALTWTLDTTTMALSIGGEGELTENYTYGSYVKSVTIGANVTDIGFDAFENCYQIKYVTLNSSAVVSKDYDYYYSSYSGYVYNTLTKIFGTGVEEYTLSGHIERIGNYAFYGSSGLKKVVIPEGCKQIGDHAFGNCGNIVTIVCPSTVEYIGTDAFSSESIMNVYNYALTPQDMSVNNLYTGYGLTLLRGVLATARLYVPQQSIELYRDAYFWCYFGNIMPIPATSVDVNDIRITTTETTVTVVWPLVDGADTYELVVKDNDGNVICTLIFNAQGQLTQITFNAQARDNAPQQTQSTGFEFTITGLKEGSPYDLIMTARDSHGSVLQTRTISFTTKSETPTAIEDIHKDFDTPTKILRDGQVLILRGEKVYTVTGQEIR